jgi:hypothetical protein
MLACVQVLGPDAVLDAWRAVLAELSQAQGLWSSRAAPNAAAQRHGRRPRPPPS